MVTYRVVRPFHQDEGRGVGQLHEALAFHREAASGAVLPCRAHGRIQDGGREDDSRGSPDVAGVHPEDRKDIRVAVGILAEGEDPEVGNHVEPEGSLVVAGGHMETADAVQDQVGGLEVHCPVVPVEAEWPQVAWTPVQVLEQGVTLELGWTAATEAFGWSCPRTPLSHSPPSATRSTD